MGYAPTLAPTPYAFSTCMIMAKVCEGVKRVRECEALLGELAAAASEDTSKTPDRQDVEEREGVEKQMLASKQQALCFWRLLDEQRSNAHAKSIADVCDLPDMAEVEGEEEGGEHDDGKNAERREETRVEKAERVLAEVEKLWSEEKGTMEEWAKELGKDAPILGNTNVAAQGVRLQAAPLAWGVMLNLIEVFDTCFPQPLCMSDNPHFELKSQQANRVAQLARSFVCLKEGSRIKALQELDLLLHPETPDAIQHLIVLQAEPNAGCVCVCVCEREREREKERV